MLKKIQQYTQTEGPAFLGQLALNSARYGWLKYILGKQHGIRGIHSYKMDISLNDPGIARTLWLVGDRERDQHYLLRHIISPGQTVLDLGANVGYYVLLEASLLKKQGKIIAVEPHPENVQQLKRNVELNTLDNVAVIHAAVAPADGTAELHVSKLSNVHSLLPNPSYAAGTTVTVPAVSLATLHEQHGAIDVIRMDIEGFEQELLDSLVTLNRNGIACRPHLLFELHGKRYDKARFRTTLEQLHSLGYRATHLSSSDTLALQQAKITRERVVATDGRRRTIARNLSLKQLLSVIWSARAVVLQTD